MTDEQIVDTASTPVEEQPTPEPPHPDLGKWVAYLHEDADHVQAGKVIAINPETGAYLIGLAGLPSVEVAELPELWPEKEWPGLDQAGEFFDQIMHIAKSVESVQPPLADSLSGYSSLGTFILIRDLFRLLHQIAGQQNQYLAAILNQQQEIAKFLFALRPPAEPETAAQRAEKLGITVVQAPGVAET